MKTVLVVEDDPLMLEYLVAGLISLEDFRVLGAIDGASALAKMQRERVDVLVTDLHMPGMDGFQLMSESLRRYPGLPVIVLTALAGDEAQEAPSSAGFLVLTKPISAPALAREIRAITSRAAPAAVVEGVSLENLLQLLNWERKTCTLTIEGRGKVGRLYLRDGVVIHAAAEELEGLEAVFRICAWPGCQVAFVDTCLVEPSFAFPADQLLMELALRKDHARPDAPTS